MHPLLFLENHYVPAHVAYTWFVVCNDQILHSPGFDRYCFIFPDCQWHSKCHWIAYRTFRGSNQHYHHADHHYGKKKIT